MLPSVIGGPAEIVVVCSCVLMPGRIFAPAVPRQVPAGVRYWGTRCWDQGEGRRGHPSQEAKVVVAQMDPADKGPTRMPSISCRNTGDDCKNALQ